MRSQSRIARLSGFLAFVADQLLQFWPPYRTETEDEAQHIQRQRPQNNGRAEHLMSRRSRLEDVRKRLAGQR